MPLEVSKESVDEIKDGGAIHPGLSFGGFYESVRVIKVDLVICPLVRKNVYPQ